MKILAILLILSLIFLAGCQRYNQPQAYPVPAQQPASTVSSTTSSTTTVFDCSQCPAGYICRNNQCILVSYSDVGGGGGSGGGGGGY